MANNTQNTPRKPWYKRAGCIIPLVVVLTPIIFCGIVAGMLVSGISNIGPIGIYSLDEEGNRIVQPEEGKTLCAHLEDMLTEVDWNNNVADRCDPNSGARYGFGVLFPETEVIWQRAGVFTLIASENIAFYLEGEPLSENGDAQMFRNDEVTNLRWLRNEENIIVTTEGGLTLYTLRLNAPVEAEG